MTGEETICDTVYILTKDGIDFEYQVVTGHDVVTFGESWFFVFDTPRGKHYISVSDVLSANVVKGEAK